MLQGRPQGDPPSQHVQNLEDFIVVSNSRENDQMQMNLEKENEWKMLEKNVTEDKECGIEVEEKLVEEVDIVKQKEWFNGNEVQVEKMQPNFQGNAAYVPPLQNIVLRRPFLITSKALINVFNKMVIIRFRDESTIFDLLELMKHLKESDHTLYYVESFGSSSENLNFQDLGHMPYLMDDYKIKCMENFYFDLGDQDLNKTFHFEFVGGLLKTREEPLAIDSLFVMKIKDFFLNDDLKLPFIIVKDLLEEYRSLMVLQDVTPPFLQYSSGS
ncbi:hypothetical protein Tco_0849413 [Tanacetum coccineum]